MSRVLRAEVHLAIDRNVTEVFAVLCDARAWSTWARWARDMVVDPPGPIRVGSELHLARRGLGMRRQIRVVTDMRPDRLIAIDDDGGSVRLWVHLEPAGDRTQLTVREELSPAGWIPFLRRRREEKQLRSELRRLKSLIKGSTGGRPAATFMVSPGVPLGGANQGH